MSLAGLSMALGAFLAGVLLAELRVPARARDRHRAVQGPAARPLLHLGRHVDRLRPARERSPCAIAALLAGFLALKVVALWCVARAWASRSAASGWLFAALLAQGGEFAFVVFGAARMARRDLRATGPALLTIAVALSMAADAAAAARCTTRSLRGARADEPSARRRHDRPRQAPGDHRRLRPLRADRRPPAVRQRHPRRSCSTTIPSRSTSLRKFGFQVFYGDATRLDLLRAAGARQGAPAGQRDRRRRRQPRAGRPRARELSRPADRRAGAQRHALRRAAHARRARHRARDLRVGAADRPPRARDARASTASARARSPTRSAATTSRRWTRCYRTSATRRKCSPPTQAGREELREFFARDRAQFESEQRGGWNRD